MEIEILPSSVEDPTMPNLGSSSLTRTEMDAQSNISSGFGGENSTIGSSSKSPRIARKISSTTMTTQKSSNPGSHPRTTASLDDDFNSRKAGDFGLTSNMPDFGQMTASETADWFAKQREALWNGTAFGNDLGLGERMENLRRGVAGGPTGLGRSNRHFDQFRTENSGDHRHDQVIYDELNTNQPAKTGLNSSFTSNISNNSTTPFSTLAQEKLDALNDRFKNLNHDLMESNKLGNHSFKSDNFNKNDKNVRENLAKENESVSSRHSGSSMNGGRAEQPNTGRSDQKSDRNFGMDSNFSLADNFPNSRLASRFGLDRDFANFGGRSLFADRDFGSGRTGVNSHFGEAAGFSGVTSCGFNDIKLENNVYKISLPVSNYAPEEIEVKLHEKSREVEVSGCHKDSEGGSVSGFGEREAANLQKLREMDLRANLGQNFPLFIEFTRRYTLPENANFDKLESVLYNGMLALECELVQNVPVKIPIKKC